MTAQSLFGDSDSHERASFRSEDAIGLTSSADTRSASTSSLYRKYRPQSFDEEELVGQEHVVRILRNAIALDRVAHAYLFSGPRGTGKTTTARVLAKAINCQQENARQRPCNVCANCRAINAGATPDLVEIDAASNRGIDDIRDLRERVRYAPTQLFSKVYIIDEAHQITGAAANAFLKTLEEPPSHTRFILATTDPEELLPTIVSRCQRFEFRRVSADAMTRRLQTVAELESISIEADALRMISRHATGSLRDALGLLEQLSLLSAPGSTDSAGNRVTASDVTKALGLSRNDRVESLVEAINQHDAGQALRVV
ncbi:MAG TPA: DNA polymerase III subunit gamma/tau, partial [Thermomicrobiales bacterium]|nr:DNA polymerase III subunit gamma/tau [Thermomicrobiales bacterium]